MAIPLSEHVSDESAMTGEKMATYGFQYRSLPPPHLRPRYAVEVALAEASSAICLGTLSADLLQLCGPVFRQD